MAWPSQKSSTQQRPTPKCRRPSVSQSRIPLINGAQLIPFPAAAAAIPLGFNPANLTPLIVAILSGSGFDKIPGVTGQVIGAASEAAHAVQAKGFRTVWLSFIPAGEYFTHDFFT